MGRSSHNTGYWQAETETKQLSYANFVNFILKKKKNPMSKDYELLELQPSTLNYQTEKSNREVTKWVPSKLT